MDREIFKKMMKEMPVKVDKDWEDDIIRGSYASIPNNTSGVANLVVAMEEFAEVSQEVSKYIRGKGNKTALTEELADAMISIRYVQLICGISDKDLYRAMNAKLTRQKDRNRGKSKDASFVKKEQSEDAVGFRVPAEASQAQIEKLKKVLSASGFECVSETTDNNGPYLVFSGKRSIGSQGCISDRHDLLAELSRFEAQVKANKIIEAISKTNNKKESWIFIEGGDVER